MTKIQILHSRTSYQFLLIIFIFLNNIAFTNSLPNCLQQRCKVFDGNAAFTCSQCISHEPSFTLYVKSCQEFEINGLYLAICVIVVLINLFMLMIGFGVYQSIYQKIQLTSILLWVQVGDINPTIWLQGTNFAIEYNNNFLHSFGVQFILGVVIIVSFLVLTAVVDVYIPQSPMGILVNRKKFIFPGRIYSLVLPIMMFGAVNSLASRNSTSRGKFQLVFCIVALITAFYIFVFMYYLCNTPNHKHDDPNYYIVSEKMTSTRWWVNNKIFFESIHNVLILIIFVVGFGTPETSCMVIIMFQMVYILYLYILVPWIKIRYKAFNVGGNIVFVVLLGLIFGQIRAELNCDDNKQQTYYKVYYFFIIIQCIVFIIANIIQIIIIRNQIIRQLRSFKNRFITCVKLNQEVQMTKYDQNGRQDKVVKFHDNVIYQCDLSLIRKKIKETNDIKQQFGSNVTNTNNYNTLNNGNN